MYTIIKFAGKIFEYFMGGIDTFKEAEEICEGYNWTYYDANGFKWELDIIKE